MNRGSWCATVHGVTETQTGLSDYNVTLGFPGGTVVKNLPANAEVRDLHGSIPGFEDHLE